jgi:hypothetical protein
MTTKTLLGAAALTLASLGTAQAATVVNGSFEDHPAVSNWAVFDTIPGWTTTSGAGIEIQTNATLGTIDAHDGNSYVELDSHNNSSMEQVISFAATGLYELSFWYSPRRDRIASNTIAYFFDGISLGSVSGPDGTTAVGSWTEITALFTVDTIGDYVLAFAAEGTDDSYGGLIDDVSISAVPLPAGGLLLLTALGGLGLARRRKG